MERKLTSLSLAMIRLAAKDCSFKLLAKCSISSATNSCSSWWADKIASTSVAKPPILPLFLSPSPIAADSPIRSLLAFSSSVVRIVSSILRLVAPSGARRIPRLVKWPVDRTTGEPSEVGLSVGAAGGWLLGTDVEWPSCSSTREKKSVYGGKTLRRYATRFS